MCVDDGFRNTNEKERKFIDTWVRKMWEETMGARTKPLSDPRYRITGTVEERVKKVLEVIK